MVSLPSFASICLFSLAAVGAVSRFAPQFVLEACLGAAGLLLLLAIYRVFVYPFYISPLRHLPEPAGGTSFPWAHAEILRKEYNSGPYRRWNAGTGNDGMIRVRTLLNQERVLVTSHAAIKEILVTKSYDFSKPGRAIFLLRQVLGNGVLVAEGEAHKVQRKALLPAFSYRHIKDLYPLFWDKARRSTDAIVEATAATGETQKAYNWASRVTLDIIGIAGMGWEFNAVDNPNGELVQVYRELFDNEPPHFRLGVLGVPQLPSWTFRLPIPQLVRARRAAAAIKVFAREIIQQKISASAPDEKKPGTVDILSVAMRSGQFNENELVDQMMTFLAAGHETTASALTWAVYFMCLYPHMQVRLRDEVRQHLPPTTDPTATVDAASVDGLPFLNAFCNEVLRCIPSVPSTSRVALQDSTIEGHRIPRGTEIWLSPWMTNVDTRLWGGDAEEFDPERWMRKDAANSGGALNNYSMMTFLHGPRSCIGKDFARAELKCLVAAWIGRFEVSWPEGKQLPLAPEGWVTVKPQHRLPVVFREVDGC